MNQLKTLTATVGNIKIGSGYPIAVQTMCNTHTYDEDATVAQCVRMHEAGADIDNESQFQDFRMCLI